MSPSCQAPSISPMALSMRCSSGTMLAVGGFGVLSFFFFFCAEAVAASDRLRSRERQREKARRSAMYMLEGSFQNFIFRFTPQVLGALHFLTAEAAR